jgi:S1-C subfamily serine protease
MKWQWLYVVMVLAIGIALYQRIVITLSRPQVVLVSGEFGLGTGFFIDDNKVMTAKHVVEDLGDYKVKGVVVTDMWKSPTQDIAILTVPTPERENKARFSIPIRGVDVSLVTVLYDQNDVELCLQKNVATDVFKYRGYFNTDVFELDLVPCPGYSGSPVFDGHNRVVGMVLGYHDMRTVCLSGDKLNEMR